MDNSFIVTGLALALCTGPALAQTAPTVMDNARSLESGALSAAVYDGSQARSGAYSFAPQTQNPPSAPLTRETFKSDFVNLRFDKVPAPGRLTSEDTHNLLAGGVGLAAGTGFVWAVANAAARSAAPGVSRSGTATGVALFTWPVGLLIAYGVYRVLGGGSPSGAFDGSSEQEMESGW